MITKQLAARRETMIQQQLDQLSNNNNNNNSELLCEENAYKALKLAQSLICKYIQNRQYEESCNMAL